MPKHKVWEYAPRLKSATAKNGNDTCFFASFSPPKYLYRTNDFSAHNTAIAPLPTPV
jgi:hypothetical protein